MKRKRYFTPQEIILWGGSVIFCTGAFFLGGGGEILSLIASLIGVTSLILNAKGNPIGQVLMIVFGVLYGIISFEAAYYGEMITYLGMTVPMALLSLIAWLKHPFGEGFAQVEAARLPRRAVVPMLALTAAVTVGFYFILAALHTAQLPLSTLSVATSFLAACLTWRRSPYFALAYAANDVVLIGLWLIAAASGQGGVSVIVCFIVFLVNDLYGFISWRRMQKRQEGTGAK